MNLLPILVLKSQAPGDQQMAYSGAIFQEFKWAAEAGSGEARIQQQPLGCLSHRGMDYAALVLVFLFFSLIPDD